MALFCLQIVLDSIGVSIWQMAAEPNNILKLPSKQDSGPRENGHANHMINGDHDSGSSESEEDDEDNDSVELHEQPVHQNTRLAVACDDGCVRIYTISSADKLTYSRSFPRVSGEKAALLEILCPLILL